MTEEEYKKAIDKFVADGILLYGIRPAKYSDAKYCLGQYINKHVASIGFINSEFHKSSLTSVYGENPENIFLIAKHEKRHQYIEVSDSIELSDISESDFYKFIIDEHKRLIEFNNEISKEKLIDRIKAI